MARCTTLKFEDYFWEESYCSSTGFEVVLKHLKDGSRMMKSFIDQLKQRAKIEEDYSKSLSKLAKSSSGADEIGSFRAAWNLLKSETEQIAQEHKILSNSFMQQAVTITAFMEEQRSSRKQQKDLVEKSSKGKVDLYNKTLDQRKSYETKCRELHDIRLKAKKQLGNQEKQIQLMVKEEKLKQETAKADETYQNMIKTLDEVKKTWEKDITKFFKLAQRLEMERLQYLHNEIWITTNFISQTCVDDDNHCENIRKSLEQCDFDADINLFIKSMSTGTEKPAPLRYVPDHYKLMDKDRFT